MWTLYESILSLCQEHGIKGGKMCVDLGLSKSLMTDLKSGRKKGITAETAQKIADYFSVSVDRVLNGPGTKKAPTQEGEREITLDDFTYAMQNEYKNLTDADKQILLSMAKQLDDARKKKNGESE
jgi:transcriptional regulator with XRE-family HTH domain